MYDDQTGDHIHHLHLDQIARGTISYKWLHIINNYIGEPVRIPLIVARGLHDGPVLGLTAAIHGNELNGLPVIQRLLNSLNVDQLHGTVIGVLCVNVPGLLREQRAFVDGVDLNRITPGRPNGNVSQLYIYRFIDRILKQFNYHIDLHTASFGRANSYYVRADMADARAARMARLQMPQIIVDNKSNDNTLRGYAEELGIHSITVELMDPHIFQKGVIRESMVGIYNILYDLNMLEGDLVCPVKRTVLCRNSYWMYTDEGGILQVLPEICDLVEPGQKVAEVRSIFGQIAKEYHAPEHAIVVGRSVNPLNQTGSRIVHLGIAPEEIDCIA